MRKTTAVEALRAQRTATVRRLSQLPDRQWDVDCLPRWTVRHVAAHLVATDEASVTGRIYPALRAAQDRREFEHWNDASVARWADQSPTELLEALERWGDRLARLVRRMPAVAAQIPFRGWLGRQPLLFLVYRRVLDEWVHECDIAWACGAAAHEPVAADDGVPDVLAAAVLYALPHGALPRAERTSGVVRLVVETGDNRRRTWAVDFARRQYGPRVAARPDAVVRTDAYTLALVAEGRWSAARVAPERLTVEGDDMIAADLLALVAPPAS